MQISSVKQLLRGVAVLLILGLLASGCGRKEAPQLIAEGAAPRLVDLKYEVNGGSLKLDFILSGSPAGVGYQIDRTEMDPYCGCPGFFRRYFEQPAFAGQVGKPLTKLINLKTTRKEFVFRIRAVDAEGNLGQWSEAIHARGVDLMK
ncbi:MAG: hypothetical protein R8L58_04825 [Mariprofundaceae bacterium]